MRCTDFSAPMLSAAWLQRARDQFWSETDTRADGTILCHCSTFENSPYFHGWLNKWKLSCYVLSLHRTMLRKRTFSDQTVGQIINSRRPVKPSFVDRLSRLIDHSHGLGSRCHAIEHPRGSYSCSPCIKNRISRFSWGASVILCILIHAEALEVGNLSRC